MEKEPGEEASDMAAPVGGLGRDKKSKKRAPGSGRPGSLRGVSIPLGDGNSIKAHVDEPLRGSRIAASERRLHMITSQAAALP
jgi:hypothetical protein